MVRPCFHKVQYTKVFTSSNIWYEHNTKSELFDDDSVLNLKKSKSSGKDIFTLFNCVYPLLETFAVNDPNKYRVYCNINDFVVQNNENILLKSIPEIGYSEYKTNERDGLDIDTYNEISKVENLNAYSSDVAEKISKEDLKEKIKSSNLL